MTSLLSFTLGLVDIIFYVHDSKIEIIAQETSSFNDQYNLIRTIKAETVINKRLLTLAWRMIQIRKIMTIPILLVTIFWVYSIYVVIYAAYETWFVVVMTFLLIFVFLLYVGFALKLKQLILTELNISPLTPLNDQLFEPSCCVSSYINQNHIDPSTLNICITPSFEMCCVNSMQFIMTNLESHPGVHNLSIT